MNRAVFLDRDGVINSARVIDGKPYPPRNIQELEIPKDVPEALARLRELNFKRFVITNQPDVARGTQSRDVVEQINRALCSALPIDDIQVCYHDNSDNCECRKPKPGMILELAKKYRIDLKRSIVIGDRWSDIAAGVSAGCRTVFLEHGYAEQRTGPQSDYIATSLEQAVQLIIAHEMEGSGK